MRRRNFLVSAMAIYPVAMISKLLPKGLNRNDKGFRVVAGEARFGIHYNMKGITSNTLDIKISGSDTDGELAVFEQTGHTPNSGPPLHIHLNQDEWFYILEGEYIFQLGNERFNMKKGDSIFLPRNIQHAFIQLSEKAKVIVSFQPAGRIEEFFKTTDTWISPPTKEEIKKVLEEFDMKVTGTPLTNS